MSWGSAGGSTGQPALATSPATPSSVTPGSVAPSSVAPSSVAPSSVVTAGLGLAAGGAAAPHAESTRSKSMSMLLITVPHTARLLVLAIGLTSSSISLAKYRPMPQRFGIGSG